MELIAAPLDFLGVNYYCRHVVRSPCLPPLPPGPPDGAAPRWAGRSTRPGSPRSWSSSPRGPATLPLYVTENGAAYPVDGDPARDPERVSFLHRHLDAARTALERGVPLRGYFVWSLLDNFEWAHGYAPPVRDRPRRLRHARAEGPRQRQVPGPGLPGRAPPARASPSVALRDAPNLDRTGSSPVRARS